MADNVIATLAHLSDVHLATRGGFGLRHWRLKRILGYLNWLRGRKHTFARRTVDLLVADMQKQGPDHVVVTGDLVNFGLPAEYIAAHEWLESLGEARQVTVVPGNHDIYVPLRSEPGVNRWRGFMSPDSFGETFAGIADTGREGFPFVRRLAAGIALVGLNSAEPTPLFVAAGSLGDAQRARVAEILDRLGREGMVRVVLIHHPPLPGQAPRRRALRDAGALQQILKEVGAELILHGHNHKNSLVWADGPGFRIPVLGIAAAGLSVAASPGGALGRYNLISFKETAQEMELIVEGRGLDRVNGEVVALERHVLPIESHPTKVPYRAVGVASA